MSSAPRARLSPRARPGSCHSELEEPDTPQHHALRDAGWTRWRAWMAKRGWGLLLCALLAAVGVWLLSGTAELQAARQAAARAGHTRRLLPDGGLVSEQAWRQYPEAGGSQQQQQEGGGSLLQAREFGLSQGSRQGTGMTALKASRAKWAPLLEELSVQPLTVRFPQLDRSLKVVLLLPPCCAGDSPSEEQALACLQHVTQRCAADAPSQCFAEAAAQPPCPGAAAAARDPQLTFFAALQQALSVLRELGWSSVRAVASPEGATGCQASAAERQAAAAALADARLILANASLLPSLLPAHPNAWFIALEAGATGTLPSDEGALAAMADLRVLAVWRGQALRRPELQNGPLLAGASHLAHLPGAFSSEAYQRSRPALLPARMVAQTSALLSHAFRFRNPLACGGTVEHLRFAGAFLQNDSHWRPRPWAERGTDVAFVARPFFDAAVPEGRPEGALLRQHTEAAAAQLAALQAERPHLRIRVSREPFSSYAAYLARLRDTKILVSPLGPAEWLEADWEAALCGCLLVKVEAGAFGTHPSLFHPIKQVLEAGVTWYGLESTLLAALQDLEHSERMAKRATLLLLEHSETRRYAGELDARLTDLVRQLPLR